MTIRIVAERPEDAAAIEKVLSIMLLVMIGKKRTVYRLQEGIEPVASLSLVAVTAARDVVGSLSSGRFLSNQRRQGALLFAGTQSPSVGLSWYWDWSAINAARLDLAKAQGIRLSFGRRCPFTMVVLGFKHDLVVNLTLPGPVDLDRFFGAGTGMAP